jgi:cysteine synthase A
MNGNAAKKDITCTVGNTPMLYIEGVYAKLEAYNPTGSVKDRMACYMLRKAEERGELKPGSAILEVTSGNTGIAFAMLSAARGYKFIAVMPENMSIERRKMMKVFGAELVLTPAKEDIAGALKKYEELKKEDPDAWLPKQFENPDNVEAHELGLGKEIADELPNVDAFVAGTGTGGTLIGVAKALKKVNPNVKIIAVEPAESPVIKGGKPGVHNIQGIGEGFVPKIVQDNINLIDEIITISTPDAIAMSKELCKKHGIFVGISSGANFLAAKQAAKKYKTVATLLPDRGERYLSCEEICG